MQVPDSMTRAAVHILERTGGTSASPTLIDRLEGLNATLARADDQLIAARVSAWGSYPTPTIGDLGQDGRLLQILDVLEQRAASLVGHADAIGRELGQ